MFTVLDSGVGSTSASPRTSADRACDQCKLRKVRCDMGKPCLTCESKSFRCTYDKERKKRGPAGKRISEIRRRQTNDHALPQGPYLDFPSTAQTIGNKTNLTPPIAEAIASGSSVPSTGHVAAHTAYWPSGTTPTPPRNSTFVSTYPNILSPTSRNSSIAGVFPNANELAPSPSLSEFVFPSLPIDSPADTFDAFGAIPQQELPPLGESADIWPTSINEETLLPWIDVYFKRLHPTVPILNRTNMYHEMLLRKHRSDSQYGAMLLSLCAMAMTQPVQIHERAAGPSRMAQAEMLLEKCVQMRVASDFGENPSLQMILTSFFLFACLFGSNKHRAARLRLREAVDLAYSLGIHLPESYEGLSVEAREQWLRTYLVLSVTERAYAIQQRHSIDFRGRPGITARFMQGFDPTSATEYINSLLYPAHDSAVEMTGLLYLMQTFDAIDESVIDCWNGHCRFSDGICSAFDRRRALHMFHAQHRARDACVSGTTPFAPTAAPIPLAKLMPSQQVDIAVTQFWLLNRLWTLCLSHGLLREESEHVELRFEFASQVGRALLQSCKGFELSAMEVHGVGLMEKMYDITIGVVTAMSSSRRLDLTTILRTHEGDEALMPEVAPDNGPDRGEMSVKTLLSGLQDMAKKFRGGDHPYTSQINTAFGMIPGWEPTEH